MRGNGDTWHLMRGGEGRADCFEQIEFQFTSGGVRTQDVEDMRRRTSKRQHFVLENPENNALFGAKISDLKLDCACGGMTHVKVFHLDSLLSVFLLYCVVNEVYYNILHENVV